ncbi:LysR family transcriptional regulator [Dorea sp. OM02-2LB]|nr:LysR family transcriptional regulator [Dorea sp. OM02-2LB]
MTIRHLKIFLAVAEYKTMSAAAEKLYISQPTVSQAIRELEEHYHGLLFERLGKKLYLTEMGKILLARSRDLVQEFQRLDDSMVEQGKKMMLRLGSTLTVGTCLTPEIILHLEEKFPGIEVRSYVSNTQEIEEKLLKSELDAAVVEGEVQSPDLVVLPIVEDILVLVCGQEHAFYTEKMLSKEELYYQKFAMREPGSGTRQLFEEYRKVHQIPIEISWEANCPRTLINAVLYNKALSVMSFRLLKHEIRHDKIRIFLEQNKEWNRKFKLVYHRNKYLTPVIRELEMYLHQCKKIELPVKYGWIR